MFAEFQRRMNRDIADAIGMTTSQLSERTTLTADALMASLREIMPAPPELRIVFTTNALKASGTERLFPSSRHRSARVRKKLIKRFGGEFRLQPALWKVGNVVYAHPIFRRELELRVPV